MPADQSTADLGVIYRGGRESFLAALETMPESSWGSKIPATPAWTVKDLLGHLSGLVDDVTNGRLDGAGTEQWTARQVALAKDLTADQLIQRWSEQAVGLETMLSSAPPSVVLTRMPMDVLTHLWDLAAVTGKRPALDDSFMFALDTYASALSYRITKRELPALVLTSGDWTYVAGEGEPEATVDADMVELFRGLSGRRSERQVLCWDWDGEPRPYMEVMSTFGELAPADVTESF